MVQQNYFSDLYAAKKNLHLSSKLFFLCTHHESISLCCFNVLRIDVRQYHYFFRYFFNCRFWN